MWLYLEITYRQSWLLLYPFIIIVLIKITSLGLNPQFSGTTPELLVKQSQYLQMSPVSIPEVLISTGRFQETQWTPPSAPAPMPQPQALPAPGGLPPGWESAQDPSSASDELLLMGRSGGFCQLVMGDTPIAGWFRREKNGWFRKPPFGSWAGWMMSFIFYDFAIGVSTDQEVFIFCISKIGIMFAGKAPKSSKIQWVVIICPICFIVEFWGIPPKSLWKPMDNMKGKSDDEPADVETGVPSFRHTRMLRTCGKTYAKNTDIIVYSPPERSIHFCRT